MTQPRMALVLLRPACPECGTLLHLDAPIPRVALTQTYTLECRACGTISQAAFYAPQALPTPAPSSGDAR